MKSMSRAGSVNPPARNVFSGKFDGIVKFAVVSFFFAGRSFAWLLPCTSWQSMHFRYAGLFSDTVYAPDASGRP